MVDVGNDGDVASVLKEVKRVSGQIGGSAKGREGAGREDCGGKGKKRKSTGGSTSINLIVTMAIDSNRYKR